MTPKEAIRNIISNTCRIDGAYYYAARKSGVGENELNMLYILDDGSEHSQHQLSLELMMPKTTVNTIVKSLLAKGLVTISQGKEKSIRLTDKGKQETSVLLAPIYEAEERAMEKVLESYDESFIKAFDYLSAVLCEELGKIGR